MTNFTECKTNSPIIVSKACAKNSNGNTSLHMVILFHAILKNSKSLLAATVLH